MIQIVQSEEFDQWLRKLRDARARARIQARILRLSMGNPGDTKPVGEGVTEMRIDYGPDCRLYFMRRGPLVFILLCGGDKSSQGSDVRVAKTIARRWRKTE